MLSAFAALSLEPGTSPRQLLARLGERVQMQGQGVVLLIDQLEELATISDEAGRDWLVELLVAVAEQPLPGVRVIWRAGTYRSVARASGLGRALLRIRCSWSR